MSHPNVNDMPNFEAADENRTRPLVAGRLINFETGKANLLDGHKSWLRDEAAKKGIAKSPNAWVNIWGYASKSGSTDFNLQLSKDRAAAVKKYLGEVIGSHQKIEKITTIEHGYGEDYIGNNTTDPNDNWGYWRAVEVLVFGSKPKIVRLPKKPQPKPQTTFFEIRVVGGFSASYRAGQTDNYVFQIVDLIRLRTMFYHYTGGGAGLSNIVPASGTYDGPPRKFSTSHPAELHQFNSTATLGQKPGVTVGPLSLGGALILVIEKIWDGTRIISTNPKNLEIEGGFGFQSPGFGSATKGTLSPLTDEAPFSGYSSLPKMVLDKLREIMPATDSQTRYPKL
jgi:hypothetical protein